MRNRAESHVPSLHVGMRTLLQRSQNARRGFDLFRRKIAQQRAPQVGHPSFHRLRELLALGKQAHRIAAAVAGNRIRSEEHTSELQSLMRISYAVFCLKKKTNKQNT